MTDVTQATTWEMPRESKEWVGPITLDVLLNGVRVPIPDGTKFAVLRLGARPTENDWTAPAVDPRSTDGLGVLEMPRPDYIRLGIWARVPGTDEDVVLEPADVGFITRT
ncbi:MAG: hypothetical protein ABI047_12705 [Jatrophihabitantaceae bacterium]